MLISYFFIYCFCGIVSTQTHGRWDAPQTSLATTKSTHLSVAYRTPCMAYILHYEITCESFKHLKVLNIQTHKVANLKFNMHLNLIFLFLITSLCFFQKNLAFAFFFAFLNHFLNILLLLQCSPPILAMVKVMGWLISTPNANSKGLTPTIKCFVKL